MIAKNSKNPTMLYVANSLFLNNLILKTGSLVLDSYTPNKIRITMPINADIWPISECKSENPYTNSIMPKIYNEHPVQSILLFSSDIHSVSTFNDLLLRKLSSLV